PVRRANDPEPADAGPLTSAGFIESVGMPVVRSGSVISLRPNIGIELLSGGRGTGSRTEGVSGEGADAGRWAGRIAAGAGSPHPRSETHSSRVPHRGCGCGDRSVADAAGAVIEDRVGAVVVVIAALIEDTPLRVAFDRAVDDSVPRGPVEPHAVARVVVDG